MVNNRARELAEEAYPSRPLYETGKNSWPQSFRNAFIEGYEAALRDIQGKQKQESETPTEVWVPNIYEGREFPAVNVKPTNKNLPLDPLPWVYRGERYAKFRFGLDYEAVLKPREGYSQDWKDYS